MTADNPVRRFRVVSFRLADVEALALHPEPELTVLRTVHFLTSQRSQYTSVLFDRDSLSFRQISVRFDHPRLIRVEHSVVLEFLG